MRYARYALAGLTLLTFGVAAAPAEAHHRGYYDPYCRYPSGGYYSYPVPAPRHYYPPPAYYYVPRHAVPYYGAPRAFVPQPYYHGRPSHGAATFYFRF